MREQARLAPALAHVSSPQPSPSSQAQARHLGGNPPSAGQIGQVLDDHRYRAAARRLAGILAAERDDGLVIDELERAAAGPRVSRSTGEGIA